MKSLKNKKVVNALVIIFIVTFAIGSVYALGAGRLEVTGTVNIIASNNNFQSATPAALHALH